MPTRAKNYIKKRKKSLSEAGKTALPRYRLVTGWGRNVFTLLIFQQRSVNEKGPKVGGLDLVQKCGTQRGWPRPGQTFCQVQNKFSYQHFGVTKNHRLFLALRVQFLFQEFW